MYDYMLHRCRFFSVRTQTSVPNHTVPNYPMFNAKKEDVLLHVSSSTSGDELQILEVKLSDNRYFMMVKI